MTRKACTFASVVVTSSVRPSAKYSFSGSVLRFAKGSTAIDRVGADAGLETRGARERGPARERLPPRVDLGLERVDARERAMDVTMYRQAFFVLPSSNCPHAAVEVGGDLLP